MTIELNHVRYYVIAAVGVVVLVQGALTSRNRSLKDDDRSENPLIAWPAWFQRIFFICVGAGMLLFALWKLWRS